MGRPAGRIVTQEELEARQGRYKTSPKFTEEQKWEIAKQFAQFKTAPDIVRWIKEHWDIEVVEQSVLHYATSHNWKPLVERARAEWAQGVAQIPIAHKRARLERLTDLIEDALADPTRRDYQKRQEIRGYLQDARLEMEEAKTHFTKIVMASITNYTDAQLKQRIAELQQRLPTLLEGGPHVPRTEPARPPTSD